MSTEDYTVLTMFSADTPDAAVKLNLHCDLLGRPQCRSSSRTRGSHGRRGAPTVFREVSRGSNPRSVSRGKPGAARSRSGTCRRKPSPQVQFRAPKLDFQESPEQAFSPPTTKMNSDAKAGLRPADAVGVNLCASGFVCDLLDDAVDDFADDIVHDVDDSYAMPTNSQAPTDAMTVLNTVEPMISECEEEDDTVATAATTTEVAAQEILQINLEKCFVQDTDSTQDSSKLDDYEEVYSLASGEAEQEERILDECCSSIMEIDEEIEAMAFTKMAISMARTAVHEDCTPPEAIVHEQQEVIQDEVQSKSELAFDFVCNVVDDAITGAASTAWQAADGADDVVDEPAPAFSVEEARIRARDILLKTAQNGELEQKLMALKNRKALAKAEVPLDVEALRKEAQQTMLQAARNGLLERVIKKHVTREDPSEAPADTEHLRQQAKKTILEGARSGLLKNVLARHNEEKTEPAVDSMDVIRKMAKQSMLQAAKNGKLEQIITRHEQSKEDTEFEELRKRAKESLMQAAMSGKLQEIVAKVKQSKPEKGGDEEIPACVVHEKSTSESEEKPWTMETLKTTLRDTLSKAAKDGHLPDILNRARRNIQSQKAEAEAAKKDAVESLRLLVRSTVVKAVQDNKLEVAIDSVKKARELNSLRLQAQQTLLQGAQSGRLAQAITKAKKGSEIAELKRAAARTLLEAADSGRLEAAFAKAKQVAQQNELRHAAKETLLQGVESGKLEQVFMTITKARTLQSLRSKAKETLSKAASGDALANAIMEVRARKAHANKLEEVRTKVRDSFYEAAAEGRLEGVFQKLGEGMANKPTEVKPDEVTHIKHQVRATLEQGIESGRLAQVFAKLKQARELKQLRSQARETLLQGAESGRLEEAFRKAKEATQEKLRLRARETLLEGVRSGKLMEAFQETRGKRTVEASYNIEDLKLKARQALTQAATNGQLSDVLQRTQPREASHDIEALKQKARQALLKVAQAGSFPEAMEAAKKARQVDGLREFARESLYKAATDGRLAEAIAKVSQAKQVQKSENLREMAKQTLLKAVEQKTLGKAVESVKKAREARGLQDLKLKVQDALKKAAENGAMEEFLRRRAEQQAQEEAEQSVEEDEPESEEEAEEEEDFLKSIARDALMQAANNGGFEKAMVEIENLRAEKAQQAEKEELRMFARSTLSQACTSGALEEAFLNLKRKREEQSSKQQAMDFKLRLRSKLVEATKAGRLNDIFRNAFQDKLQVSKDSELEAAKESARGALENALKEKEMQETPLTQPAVPTTSKASPTSFSLCEQPQHFTMATPPGTPGAQVRMPKVDDIQSGASSPTGRSPKHSKSKHRIIGGVSRSSSSLNLDELTSRSGRRTKTIQKEDKNGLYQSSSTPKLLMQQPPLKMEVDWSTCVKAFGAPAFDRPPSKASARLRKAVSMSALAMDLGSDASASAPTSPPPTLYSTRDMANSASRSSSSPFEPISFTAPQQRSLERNRASSLSALRPTKSKASGLLPSLPGKSTESIAWSMEMSKASSKWSKVDWQHGTGAVF